MMQKSNQDQSAPKNQGKRLQDYLNPQKKLPEASESAKEMSLESSLHLVSQPEA